MKTARDLRERAQHLRWLGKHAGDEQTRRMLESMADWFQLRAAMIDAKIAGFRRRFVRRWMRQRSGSR